MTDPIAPSCWICRAAMPQGSHAARMVHGYGLVEVCTPRCAANRRFSEPIPHGKSPFVRLDDATQAVHDWTVKNRSQIVKGMQAKQISAGVCQAIEALFVP